MATHSSILAWRIPMDRGALPATVHGVAELGMTEWQSVHTSHTHTHTPQECGHHRQERLEGEFLTTGPSRKSNICTLDKLSVTLKFGAHNLSSLGFILFPNMGYSDYNKFRTLPKLCSNLSEYSWQSSWRKAVHDRKFFLFNYACNMQWVR